ncbi:hypothetical protein [Methanimicrococcus hongohii]|uniref:hypothetical protein n=1 Tax=Methanimicrococcus hongohii TaxID=3028295 RepID=UPI0029309E45|nr:hypothetical protein [Methanimicrococcus sp. Hf6]
MEANPEGIVFCDDMGHIIPESFSIEKESIRYPSGPHLWNFSGQKNGTVELDFKLTDLSDKFVKEEFIYQIEVAENNRVMKLLSVLQVKTINNPLETGLKIEENKTVNITLEEQLDSAGEWILETVEYGKLKMISEETFISESGETNIHNWKFEGETQGSVRLTYRSNWSETVKCEIHYDVYINEDMTIELINAEYNKYTYE